MKTRRATAIPSFTVLLAVLLITVLPSAPAVVAQTPTDPAVVAGLEWRAMGPATMGGRVSDLAVNEADPAEFYVATATGGLWKTVNHGTSFEPVFANQVTASVGAVTLAPSNPNVVWVGTGEPQNRQSSPWGAGVFRSVDGGRTWQGMGLEETRHVGRIVIHPRDPDVVYVAAVGHLWGSNPERGVYRTTDGGESWERVLYVDENTGAIDLVMDPGDPRTLFAAMYQRRRTSWGFSASGPGSGLYRTLDGGESWTELTNGLPEGDKGRIGLDIWRRDGNVVFALIESRPGQGRGVYRSLDRGESWQHLSDTNPRPMYFSMIRVDPNDMERIYLGGVQLMISDDGGKTFTASAREVHSDHHALWIDPDDSDHLLMGGDGGVTTSFDRAGSWRAYDNIALAQFYEIGYDMRDPYYVCGGLQDNGSWCGPSATWSRLGIRNSDWYNVGGGDGFYVRIDPQDPTIVFSESQNGNIARFDLKTGERQRIRPERGIGEEGEMQETEEEDEDAQGYRWNWNTPLVISAHDPSTIYAGANHLLKSTDRGLSWQEISPDLTRNLDRDDLEIMGARVTARTLSRHDGVSSFGNITTFSESPVDPAVLYVGTDDGKVQGTRDGGATWTDLTPRIPGVPEMTYVSRVLASGAAPGRVYVTFDGHYADDYRPYVYSSDDFGSTWRAINSGLPDWSVNVIAEHPRSHHLLFVGNEVGVYFSIDRGASWAPLKNDLPTVPVDDIAIHPRENDLILGTHGLGVWILPDIAPLERMSAQVLASAAHLYPVRTATSYNVASPQGWTPGAFQLPDPPYGAMIRYHVGRSLMAEEDSDAEEEPKVRFTILDAAGTVVRSLEGPGTMGMHQVLWDLRWEPAYEPDEEGGGGGGGRFGGFGSRPQGPRVLPGTYTLRMEAGETSAEGSVNVRLDPRVTISTDDLRVRQEVLMTAYALAKPLYESTQALARLNRQISSAVQMLGESEGTEALKEEATGLQSELGEIGRRLGRLRQRAGSAFAVEGSTSRPTRDQVAAVEWAWETAPGVIEELNGYITERIPAFNRKLDQAGVRPSPGEPVALPARPGR